MIKISYKPITEIVVHHMRKLNQKMFLQRYATPEDAFLNWADGFLLSVDSFDTETSEYLLSESLLHGTLHIRTLDYCILDKYQRKLKIEDYNHEVQILEVSKDPLFKEIVSLIKAHDKEMVEV